MSVYEKVKAELARKNLELEQQLEQRRRNFDIVFGKIVPRLESYFQKESDALLRDGGRAKVSSKLESPLRSITNMLFALPYEHQGLAPSHSYQLTVTMERLCTAEGKLDVTRPKSATADLRPALLDVLGGVDEPDFLIKLDKSLARFLEMAIHDDERDKNAPPTVPAGTPAAIAGAQPVPAAAVAATAAAAAVKAVPAAGVKK